jgi:hypothetical protein
VRASDATRAVIAIAGIDSKTGEVDPYALTALESDAIDFMAASQAATGENDPLSRQTQAWELAEMEKLLQDNELLDVMEQYFPVAGYKRGMTLADVILIEQAEIRSGLENISEDELSVRLNGVAFQIYNISDILGKFAPSEEIQGTPFAAFPVVNTALLNQMLEETLTTRRLLIDECRRRGLL